MKIILIQLWLGKIPDYFWYHYDTTKNINGIEIFKYRLPKQIFVEKNNQALKSGDWKFGSYFQINENLANQISDVEIKP